MKRYRILLAACALVGLLLLPEALLAAGNDVFPTGYWGSPLLSCTGSGEGLKRCEDLCDVANTAENIINFALTIVFFVLVPLMIMWGGFLMLTSAGSSEKVSQAKSVFTGAAIGVALGLGAYLIVDTFFGIIKPTIPGQGGGASSSVKWYQLNCGSKEFDIFKL